ncbi:fumarylacetoacetate hydrolase family protein [bacterium]|nr:fumarylacetoacetate hydrolase family protein [bacterium]
MKSRNAFCGPASRVPYPVDTDFFWTEVELGVVVGSDCHRVTQDEAKAAIAGFVVCADLSCRNLHERDHHLGFSKSRAFFCPTSDEIVQVPEQSWRSLRMTTAINGNVTQEGTTEPMLFGPVEAVEYVARISQIKAGDLIITGTPPGWRNNGLKSGDLVRHTIEKVGELEYEIE